MKSLFLLLACLFVGYLSIGQKVSSNEITPRILQKLKADIEKQLPEFKKQLSRQELTADQMEFAVDTFRIEQLVSKRIDIDYSTQGMNKAVQEMTKSYDSLMNKYYTKLLQVLKQEDKKILVNAQKAWLIYRDTEAKLIGTLTKIEYSGGGSIQSNIAVGSFANLIVRRAVEIFNYYDGIVK
ncbi:MAG: lysozyme inhibitor LprI family protein [Bacteroidota bacterium]